MAVLKLSTARARTFMMIDSADHVTGKTGLTVDVDISKAGAAFGNAGGAVAELANGWYKITLTTTDTNTFGDLAYHCTAAGADPTDFTDTVGDIWDQLLTGANYNVLNSAGRFLRQAGGGSITTLDSGTAQSGTTNTIRLASTAVATNSVYVGATVAIDGGTGLGQTRRIINYVGSTRVATVDKNWSTTPDNTSTYDVLAASNSVFADEGLAQSATASTLVIRSGASAVDDLYNNSFISILSGTGSGQTRIISDYTGASRTITPDTNWSVTPDATSGYGIIPQQATAADTGGGTAPSVEEIADGLLNRNLAGGSNGTRTVRGALRALRNKTAIAGSTLTVYAEDDTTADWTAAITTASGNPISSVDPA